MIGVTAAEAYWRRQAEAAEAERDALQAKITAALERSGHADDCGRAADGIVVCDCWRSALTDTPGPKCRDGHHDPMCASLVKPHLPCDQGRGSFSQPFDPCCPPARPALHPAP